MGEDRPVTPLTHIGPITRTLVAADREILALMILDHPPMKLTRFVRPAVRMEPNAEFPHCGNGAPDTLDLQVQQELSADLTFTLLILDTEEE